MNSRELNLVIFWMCLHWANSNDAAYVVSDDQGVGRRFDGIGGISGGSATSKLLVNYPEVQRNEILDYLFKPNFGASLQILKVEIGGDSQAAGGTESSHMHERWDENYQRGYEWWMMTEAKKRNPNIKLYGLPWSFPGWLGRGSGSPYKYIDDTVDYVIRWILGAKKHYNLDIDYIGIWNEKRYNSDYVIALKKALNGNGLTKIQVVVSDDDWSISDEILRNATLASAVDIIGAHYPGGTTDASIKTGKTLWSSEDYSTFNDDVGAGCWARILNQNYVGGYMTSTISWNLIASYYPALPMWNRQGLMTAQEPWSGYYVVENPIWTSAHTTQFTEIGWDYLQHGRGVHMLEHGGNVVSLASPDRSDFTIVIQTMTHNHSICIRPVLPPFTVETQRARFLLGGNLSKIKKFYFWKTHLRFDATPSSAFVQMAPVVPDQGIITLDLEPDHVYTLTTLSTGQKGTYPAPPGSQPFPLPYQDTFDDYPEYSEMYNFAGQNGVFEVRQTNDPDHDKVNRQVVLHDPIYWCDSHGPTLNLGGNSNWSHIEVSVDIFIPSVNGTSGAYISARTGPGGCGVLSTTGIFFFVYPTTDTFVVSSDITSLHILEKGTCRGLVKLDTWITLRLVIVSNTAYGFLGSVPVFSCSVPETVTNGFAAYGTATFGYADFDNWIIKPGHSLNHFQMVANSHTSKLQQL